MRLVKIHLLDVVAVALKQLLVGFVGVVTSRPFEIVRSRLLVFEIPGDVGDHGLGLVVELRDLGVDGLNVFGHLGFILGHERCHRLLVRSDSFLHPVEFGPQMCDLVAVLIEKCFPNLAGATFEFFGNGRDLSSGRTRWRAVNIDARLDDAGQFAGMGRLQRVEFDGAFAVACLEMTFARVAVLDRAARQAVVPDLGGG